MKLDVTEVKQLVQKHISYEWNHTTPCDSDNSSALPDCIPLATYSSSAVTHHHLRYRGESTLLFRLALLPEAGSAQTHTDPGPDAPKLSPALHSCGGTCVALQQP